MRLHRSAHTVYKTQDHVVWVTRFRRTVLVPGVARYLRVKLEEVHKWYPDWKYVAIGIEPDHVHLHVVIPPKYAVSWVVETLKKNTSRALSEKFAFLKEVYWDEDGIWTRGASSLRWGRTKRSSGGTWRCKARKTPDKRSLNGFKSTTPVKAWVSIDRWGVPGEPFAQGADGLCVCMGTGYNAL